MDLVSQNVNKSMSKCPVCGGGDFIYKRVLWQGLIAEWQLSEFEAAYIDRQQGFHCVKCGGNLRSMALADAIVMSYGYQGTLDEFCRASSNAGLKVLEINAAGTLTKHFKVMPEHRLVNYPEFDMTKLDIDSASFDLVIHSDTLEHINYPETAMKECRRVLRKNGRCIFTIPIIVGRLTRSRAGLNNSFHGCANDEASDLLVHTEFGADFWTTILSAGFKSCSVYCLEYPAGLAIEAKC